ncbi:MAG TPA: recombinase family protein [Phycisphaerae bacterium]|nr:recombinase family protein [Phycisphaerae bacterium]
MRMSTEHQQYSTENQADVIREYAQNRGYRIVKTYADEGKSGLRIEGRDALRQMIDDVQGSDPGYEAILAYDISRWGRFQDSDESAYYEYICKRAGIQVLYCAEQFENDGSPTSTIIKSVKRAMAGEYSRELSSKVFKGQCKLIELGYRQGGPSGFGLRRMLIDIEGKPKGVLKRGEQKSLQTDRVVLVPGPEDEVSLVRHMYQLFIKHCKTETEIAAYLNQRGILTDAGRKWTRSTVRQVLTNEKYIGNNVYNRISFKLKKKRIVNPPDLWVRADGVYDAIIDPASFFRAQGIIQERNRRFSNEELIAMLSRLIEQHSDISAHLIDQAEGIPSSATYRARFGTLVQAYRLAGFEPDRDFSYVEINRRLRQLHPTLMDDTVQRLESVPESSPFRTLANCQSGAGGRFGWLTGRGVAGYEATKNGSVISVCGSETIAKADRGYCPCGRRSALSHPDNSSIAPKAESEKGLHSVPARPARNSNQSRS